MGKGERRKGEGEKEEWVERGSEGGGGKERWRERWRDGWMDRRLDQKAVVTSLHGLIFCILFKVLR